MRECSARNDAAIASDSWRSGLLEEGGLVFFISTKTYYFVVRTLPRAVWLWPAIQHGTCFAPDPTITRLEVKAIFSFDDVRMQPYAFRSPLHMRVVSAVGTPGGGVQIQATGPHCVVMQSQAERGFPFVDESVLECALTSLGAPVIDKLKVVDYTLALKLKIMLKLDPELSQMQANIRLSRCEQIENPDRFFELPVDAWLLNEICHPTEAKGLQTDEMNYKEQRAKKADVAARRQRQVKASVKRVLPKAFVKPKVPAKVPRWIAPPNTTAATCLTYIETHMPQSLVKITMDPIAGRYRCLSPEDAWSQSVSWTSRGFAQTASECLHALWTKWGDLTGLATPTNLDELPPLFEAVA